MISKIIRRIKWIFQDIYSVLGITPNFDKRKGELQVLCFHGICEDNETYINGRFMKLSKIRELLISLKEKTQIVSWDHVILNQLNQKKLNILITFDDGYLNNKTLLLPVIEELSIPIILFVTGRDSEPLWTDLLDITHHNKLSVSDVFGGSIKVKKNKRIKRCLIQYNNAELEMIKEKLFTLIEPIKEKYENFWKLLSNQEIEILSNNSLITIGNHTMNHSNLKLLNSNELEDEVIGLAKQLDLMGIKNNGLLAYPYGLVSVELVKKLNTIGICHHFLLEKSVNESNCYERLVLNPFISTNNNLWGIRHGKF